MVQEFAMMMAELFAAKNTKLAIFFEPQLETGFPDLVLVEYRPYVMDKWSKARCLLTKTDLKVIQHLYNVGELCSEDIERQLGLSSKQLLLSIERLLDAHMLKREHHKWMPYSLKNTYAINNIVAIEAKINNWQEGLRQAEHNKWFASESYVLSPVQSPSEVILIKSRNNGIGIYSLRGNMIKKILPSARFNVPSCYGSWLLNEWIGQHIHSSKNGE